MEQITTELENLIKKCEETEDEFQDKKIQSIIEQLKSAISKVALSWSQSWLGYHAYVYYERFVTPPPDSMD